MGEEKCPRGTHWGAEEDERLTSTDGALEKNKQADLVIIQDSFSPIRRCYHTPSVRPLVLIKQVATCPSNLAG